jgi:hypothetical protein
VGTFDHLCQSGITSTTTTLLYIDPSLDDNVWYSTEANIPLTTTIETNSTYIIYGDGIPIWWQNSDLAAFSAATKTSASTQPTASTTQPTSTPSPTNTPSHHGLSSGAKIGIGIGIPLVLIAIGVIAFAIYIRSRRRDRVAQAELRETAMYKPPIQELGLGEGVEMHEMYSENAPYDPHYPRNTGRHELPSHY